MSSQELVIANQKANAQALFDLSEKVFAGVEKLVELNLQAAKASLQENQHHVEALLAVKDAQGLVALQASFTQPLADKAASYSRHVYDIAKETGEAIKAAADAQGSEAQKQFSTVLNSSFKNAPAGTEQATEFIKSTISSMNAAFETVQKSLKQVHDLTEANVSAVTKQATEAVKSATKAKKS
jgi:phasin family protein